MNAGAARGWLVTLGLLLLAGGCAPVGPAAKRAVSKPALMVVQAAEGSAVALDAFEGLLMQAGMESLDQLPSRTRPLDGEGAMRLLALLMEKPFLLRNFPQRMGVCFLLREVMEGG